MLAWIFFVGTGVFPQFGLSVLQTHPYLKSPKFTDQTVIVLLGGGAVRRESDALVSTKQWAYGRLFEAARLYRLCEKEIRVCKILVTGGDPAKSGQAEAEIMKRELTEIGIPADHILVETQSLNTAQNAKFCAPIIDKNGFDQVILVTSGFHMTRALVHFRRYSIEPISAPADRLAPFFAPLPISVNFWLADIVFHEWGGILIADWQN